MVFTAHSIQLTGRKTTMPWKTLLADTQQCKAIFRTLNKHFPLPIRPTIRIADLGSFEGGYAVEAARQGYQVTGFEARANNFENCAFVQRHLNLPNLSFIQDDVENWDNHGTFDVILCLGLPDQDHMKNPAAFLRSIGALTKSIIVLDTHYTQGRRWFSGKFRWPSKADLLQAFRDAGFSLIYEQYDWLEDMHDPQLKRQDRGLFVGCKP